MRTQIRRNHSPVRRSFTASPAPIDSQIDRAVSLAEHKQTDTAIGILTDIAKTNSDYQVRALAYYQIGQIYLAQGDLKRWGWTLTYLDADKSGMAIQTSWRYGLDDAQSTYFLNSGTGPDYDLRRADVVADNDVTENPEPRFHRALVNARYENLNKAKIDIGFLLKLEPNNPSY